MARHSGSVKLIIRQHPHHALVTNENKEKGRKPIDPPPIVQMHADANQDPNEYWLVNPFLFMVAMIVDANTEEHVGSNHLVGQNVSSLHRLKDIDNKDGGFFVFGDISVRNVGVYKLQFSLYDYDKTSGHAILVDTVQSNEFKVVSSKDFKGLAESTHLSRHFSEQGVRLRLRKEPRANTGTKRTWANTLPPEPSTPSGHTGHYGGPVHSHTGYDIPPLKRQRSSEDYGSSYMYNSYPVRNSTYGTSFSSDGSNGASTWGASSLQHDSKGYASEAASQSLSGMMTPTQTHPQPTLWQRGLSLSSYGGAVGSAPVSTSSGGVGSYFTSGLGGTTGSGSRSSFSQHAPYTTPQHHQAQSHLPSQYTGTLRSSTSSELYPSLTGLHTPTSLSDSLGPSASGGSGGPGNGVQSGYLHSSTDSHAATGAIGGNSNHQQAMAHFTGRGLSLEQPLVGGTSSSLHESATESQGNEYMF